jgi:tetratricopeptide (TPR) repeat protein
MVHQKLHPSAVLLLGLCLIWPIDLSKALAEVDRSAQAPLLGARGNPNKNTDNLESLLYQVENTDLNQKHSESEQIWRKISQLYPEEPTALYHLGHTLFIQTKSDEAIAIYRQILQENPQSAKAYFVLGHTLLYRNLFRSEGKPVSLEELKEAIAVYRQGLVLEPDRVDSLDWGIGPVRQKMLAILDQEIQGQKTKAVTDYLMLWSAHRSLRQELEAPAYWRKNFPVCQKMQQLCEDRGTSNPLLELSLLETAMKLDPNLGILYEMQGISFYEQNQYDKAIESLQKAAQLMPQKFRVHYRLGVLFTSQNQPEKAIASLYQAIKTNPHKASLGSQFFILPQIHGVQIPQDKIISMVLDEVEKRPNAMGYYLLGGLLASVNYDYPEKLAPAAIAYRNAIKLDPNFAIAYTQLGITLELQNKLPEAEVALKKAIQLNPQLNDAYASLRDLLRKQKRFDEAYGVFLAMPRPDRNSQ